MKWRENHYHQRSSFFAIERFLFLLSKKLHCECELKTDYELEHTGALSGWIICKFFTKLSELRYQIHNKRGEKWNCFVTAQRLSPPKNPPSWRELICQIFQPIIDTLLALLCWVCMFFLHFASQETFNNWDVINKQQYGQNWKKWEENLSNHDENERLIREHYQTWWPKNYYY